MIRYLKARFAYLIEALRYGFPKCDICDRRIHCDDLCLFDITLGDVHADCCGPERESYINLESGEPLGEDEPLPQPYPYSDLLMLDGAK